MSGQRDTNGYRHGMRVRLGSHGPTGKLLHCEKKDKSGWKVKIDEHVREAALARIHADELNRMDAILSSYELERANAKVQIQAFCAQFGSHHVAEWVLAAAKGLGHSL